MEKTVHFFQADKSREAVCRRGSNEVEGLPGAPKDVVVEESDATVTETRGPGRESIDIFSVTQVSLEFLCRDEVRRFAIELSPQAYLSAIGGLRTFARATALQSGNHLWAPRGHDRPPLLS
jgi:hypothetical protein